MSARRLHLALVTANPVRTGGMQTFTRGLVRALLARGWRVTVALSGEDIYSADAPADGGLRIEQVDWVDTGLAGDRHYRLAVVRDRFRWFRRTRPDVALFVQSSNTPFRASIAGAWLARVPVVSTHRTMPAVIPHVPSRRHVFGLLPGLGLHRHLTIARTWLTSRMASRVVFNSSAVLDAYRADYGYAAANACVIRNAVLAEKREPKASDRLRVGFVGRLGKEKRLDVLLRAVSLLQGACSVETHFYGEGPERRALERLANELGLRESVVWHGATDDAWSAYAALDAVVLCSPRESSSNMVLEAMAAGKAVVVTSVGGQPELVGHGEYGICVPPGDPDALASALGTVASDENLRTRLGRRAREAVIARHDSQLIWQAWHELLSAAGYRFAASRRADRRSPAGESAPLPSTVGFGRPSTSV